MCCPSSRISSKIVHPLWLDYEHLEWNQLFPYPSLYLLPPVLRPNARRHLGLRSSTTTHLCLLHFLSPAFMPPFCFLLSFFSALLEWGFYRVKIYPWLLMSAPPPLEKQTTIFLPQVSLASGELSFSDSISHFYCSPHLHVSFSSLSSSPVVSGLRCGASRLHLVASIKFD